MSRRSAIGNAMLPWSAAFVIASIIALALDCDGIAMVLFAISGGLLFAYVAMLALALMNAGDPGRSQPRGRTGSGSDGSQSLSGRLRPSTDSGRYGL